MTQLPHLLHDFDMACMMCGQPVFHPENAAWGAHIVAAAAALTVKTSVRFSHREQLPAGKFGFREKFRIFAR
jgi:hypothetical protein